MTDPYTKLKTSIQPDLLKKHLKYAVMVGAIGVLVLILASIFIKRRELNFIGPLIMIVWVFLGISAIRPYAQLKKLQYNPDELIIRKTSLIYKGKLIAINRIKKIHYIDKPDEYGLKFEMNDGKSLFLPYFTKQSFDELKKQLQE